MNRGTIRRHNTKKISPLIKRTFLFLILMEQDERDNVVWKREFIIRIWKRQEEVCLVFTMWGWILFCFVLEGST